MVFFGVIFFISLRQLFPPVGARGIRRPRSAAAMEQDQGVAAAAASENPSAGQGAHDSGSAGAGAAASSIASFDSATANPDANVYSQNPSSVPQADGAQGADASVYPADHAPLNGTSGQVVDYQSAGAAENGAATNEMGEPVPEQSYADGNVSHI